MDRSTWYSHQPWYIKVIRNWCFILVPYETLQLWWYGQTRQLLDEEDWRMSFSNAWSVARGLADVRRKHFRSWDEIKRGLP
jgi:hypothetical protein